MASLAPATTPRAAIYVRVSTQGQEEDGTSLDTQLERCRAHCAERGYLVAEEHVYREVHTGTELWERPKLSGLRESVRHRLVDVVVAYAIDRLSRDPVHLGVLISEADHAGADVQFVSEPLDNSPEGQLIRYVRGYAARIEHEKIRERSMRGRLARVGSGKLLAGCKPPYGYSWRDAHKGALVEDPEAAPTVRRLFALSLDGWTLRRIAVQLNAEALPTPKGRARWDASLVSRLLRRRIYAGEAVALTHRSFRRDGKWQTELRPDAERLALPDGTVPALVDADTFEGVQAQLATNQRFALRNNHHPEQTLLRNGFARCGHSGAALTASADKRGTWYYACPVSARDAGCPSHKIKAATLDKAVWQRVEALLTNPTVIAGELDRMEREDRTGADLEAVERQIAEADRKQANLARRIADEEDDDVAAVLRVQLGDILRSKRQLEAERATVAARREQWAVAHARLDQLQRWCLTVAANLAEATYEQKRDALLALGVEARVYRVGSAEPRYRITADIPLDGSESHNCVANRATFTKLRDLVTVQ